MKPFLISYDLVNPGRDYSRLYEAIKAYGTWAHVLESVWLIVSSDSCKAIRDNLAQHMDSNDKLIVVQLQGNWASRNLGKEIADWLENRVSPASSR